MRIAYIVDFFPALSETFILNQITGLIDRGHDVQVFGNAPSSEVALPQNIQEYELGSRTRYRPERPRQILKRSFLGAQYVMAGMMSGRLVECRALNIRRYHSDAWSLKLLYGAVAHRPRQEFDVIHCHFGSWGLHGQMLREIGAIGGRLVTTFHGFDVSCLPTMKGMDVYQPLFAQGDLFLAISEKWKGQLIEMGAPPGRTRVHRMGIDTSMFDFRERTLEAASHVKLLSVGRLVEKKGIADALRATAILLRRGLSVEHLIVGDGPLRKELESLVASLGIGTKVRFLGSQPHDAVARLMEESDLLVAQSPLPFRLMGIARTDAP